MFDIGFWEIFLIAVVALIVVGPERMPKMIRVMGLWIGRANASIQSVRSDISRELRAEELRKTISDDGSPSIPRYIVPDETETSTEAPAEKSPLKTEKSDKDNNGDG